MATNTLKKSSSFNPWTKKHAKAITILSCIVALVVALVLFDLSPLGGNIQFYAKWAECGRRPLVVSGPGFLNSTVPYYHPAPIVGLVRNDHYFCTPFDAEKRGYSASPTQYDSPELKKHEWCQKQGDPRSETAAILPTCQSAK